VLEQEAVELSHPNLVNLNLVPSARQLAGAVFVLVILAFQRARTLGVLDQVGVVHVSEHRSEMHKHKHKATYC
jgi:hypothetical protein